MVGMPSPLRKTACASRVSDGTAELTSPLRCLIVDIRDVFEPAVADHFQAMLLQERLAFERGVLAVGRAERDTRRAEHLEGVKYAAESRRDRCPTLISQTLYQLGLRVSA